MANFLPVTRNRLLALAMRADSNAMSAKAAANEVTIRDQTLFGANDEDMLPTERLQSWCDELAQFALRSLRALQSADDNDAAAAANQTSSIDAQSIEAQLDEIFSNNIARLYYSTLLAYVLKQSSLDQAAQVERALSRADDLRIVATIWPRHTQALSHLIDTFVPHNTSGRELRAQLSVDALRFLRRHVIFGSSIGSRLRARQASNLLTQYEKLASIRLLNAVDTGEFRRRHAASVRVELRARLDLLVGARATPKTVVAEAEQWLRVEAAAIARLTDCEAQRAAIIAELTRFVICDLLIDYLARDDRFARLVSTDDTTSRRGKRDELTTLVFVQSTYFKALHRVYLLFASVVDAPLLLINLFAEALRARSVALRAPPPPTAAVAAAAPRHQPPTSGRHTNDDVTMIGEFLAFEYRCLRQIAVCFGDARAFHDRLGRELRALVALRPRFATAISAFVDARLRQPPVPPRSSGSGEMAAAVGDEPPQRAIRLLRYIDDKEAFETSYRHHLSLRLLNLRSLDVTPSAAAATSADRTISSRLAAERAIVEQLAAENGVVFTRSLARMINDVRDSCTLVAEFGLSTRDGDNNQQATSIIADIEDGSWANVSGGGGINEPPVAFAVTVATDTFWPPHLRAAAASCRLPPMIASVCDEFERFYLGRHEGRRLRWCAAASVAVVAARFLGAEAALETTRRVEANQIAPLAIADNAANCTRATLVVNGYQLAILDLFNDRSFVTIQDLHSLTLPDVVLKRACASLTSTNVLRRVASADASSSSSSSPSFALASTDRYIVNEGYRPRRALVNLRRPLVSVGGSRGASTNVGARRELADS